VISVQLEKGEKRDLDKICTDPEVLRDALVPTCCCHPRIPASYPWPHRSTAAAKAAVGIPSLRRRRSAGSVRCSTERRLVGLVDVLGGPVLSAPQTAVTHVIACQHHPAYTFRITTIITLY